MVVEQEVLDRTSRYCTAEATEACDYRTIVKDQGEPLGRERQKKVERHKGKRIELRESICMW